MIYQTFQGKVVNYSSIFLKNIINCFPMKKQCTAKWFFKRLTEICPELNKNNYVFLWILPRFSKPDVVGKSFLCFSLSDFLSCFIFMFSSSATLHWRTFLVPLVPLRIHVITLNLCETRTISPFYGQMISNLNYIYIYAKCLRNST